MAKVKQLFDIGVPLDYQNEIERTALHRTSLHRSERTGVIQLFIELKANLNITDRLGDTALILAAYRNKERIVCLLVEAGADIRIRCKTEKNAADWAKMRGNDDISRYLTNRAPTIRFHHSFRDENGKLCLAKGRSLRAVERDLKENGVFVSHVLFRLMHFCVAKRR